MERNEEIEKAKAKLETVAEDKENAAKMERQPETRTVTLTRREEQRVISGEPRKPQVRIKKKTFGEKLKESIFGEDLGTGSITDHIVFKIFIPSVKRIFGEMINTAVNMTFGLNPGTKTINVGQSHTSQASIYRDRNLSRSNEGGNIRRTAIADYRMSVQDAEWITDMFNEHLRDYPTMSIAQAYSIMGCEEMIRSTDKNWGWGHMHGITVVPIGVNDQGVEEAYIDMPPARPI